MTFRLSNAKTYLPLLLLLALAATGLSAAEPLRVATLPAAPPGLANDLVGAYIQKTQQPTVVVTCAGFNDIEAGLKAGCFDVVLGTCPGSSKVLQERGLLVPESDTILYHYRRAMILPPGNPKGIFQVSDLDREGVKVGLCTRHAPGALVEKLKQTATVLSPDQDLLLDLLEESRLDVVVGLDACGRARPQLVTIRLPRSVAGEGAVIPGHSFVVTGTSHKDEAEAFLAFCDTSNEARDVMLRRSLMLGDGSHAGSYKGAAHRMMPAYQSIARQIKLDYAKGCGNCLDLGCGTGEMTVEVAKETGLATTGLDIEPEALEFAAQYASECGLRERMRWVAADVHSLPFPDGSFDLVISRGSIFFWRDQATALREVMRVLRPGGYAFIGGGSGRFLSKEDWDKIHPGVDPATNAKTVFNFPFPLDNVPALMARAGISDYRHLTEGGTWIEFRKPAAMAKAG